MTESYNVTESDGKSYVVHKKVIKAGWDAWKINPFPTYSGGW